MCEIRDLIIQYGNIRFDCGEWDLNDEYIVDNHEKYDLLVESHEKLLDVIIETIEERVMGVS